MARLSAGHGSVTEPLELMRLHVEALFTHDSAGRLVRVNETNGAHAPRFFLGHTADGDVLRFRHDVDDELRAALEAAARECSRRGRTQDVPPDATPFAAILARAAPVEHTWCGPAFTMPPALAVPNGVIRVVEANASLLETHLERWLPDVPSCQPMLAVALERCAVAVCCSVRVTCDAHEGGVDTAPAFRRRGLAARVVAAWALAVRELDRVPLYSTSWRNEASRGVARTLGLVHFGSDLHIT
jgi:hypothetical protein